MTLPNVESSHPRIDHHRLGEFLNAEVLGGSVLEIRSRCLQCPAATKRRERIKDEVDE